MVFLNALKDERYIAEAIGLAARARGRTSPNPLVGALIVRNGKIVSSGYHRKAGTPHAEAIAIEKAGTRARGATLYVSLEPCCHRDKRTPPCTEKIISSGIRRVVIAMKDPNPKVSGMGIAALRKAGVAIDAGILEDKARLLNETYIKYITTGMPFVTLKVAMTLDGKIATPEGESQWITGDKARRLVHGYRGRVDAILSAIGTVQADDPLLTCRLSKGKSPSRIIIDPQLAISPDARLLSMPPDTLLVVERRTHYQKKRKILSDRGIRFIDYPGERLDLVWLMTELGKREITSLLIEGGSSLNASCLESGIVDKVLFFIAPKIIGGRDSFPAVGGTSFRRLAEAIRIQRLSIKRVGTDILVEGYPSREELHDEDTIS